MSLLTTNANKQINLTILTTGACAILSPVVGVNQVLTFGKVAISRLIFFLAQILSEMTGGGLQLNRLVSFAARKTLREFGIWVARFKSKIHQGLANQIGLSVENTRFLRTVVIGPVTEEIVHRLPLLALSPKIDAFPMASQILAPRLPFTFGQLIKITLASLLSIVFVYGHHRKPSAGRAATLFTSGLIYSYLTLNHQRGFLNAIFTHSLNNLVQGTRRWIKNKFNH